MNGIGSATEKQEEASSLSHALSKIAVTQICQTTGFRSAERSALEGLSEIATRYLQYLGKSAHSHANSMGRTACNVFDIIHAIEELGSSHGFLGASDVNRPLLKSATLTQIMSFVDSTDEIPFAKPIPRKFPVKITKHVDPSFVRSGQNRNQNPPFTHVPSWLPCFPHPITYRNDDMVRDDCYSVQREGISFGQPKISGENQVSVVHPPGKDVFLGCSSKRVLPSERPRVRFRLGFKETSLSRTVNPGSGKTLSREDDQMSVRKRREDMIEESSLC